MPKSKEVQIHDRNSRRRFESIWCLVFFYRLCSNNADLTFSKKENDFFNLMANKYNAQIEGELVKVNTPLTMYFKSNNDIVKGNVESGEEHALEGLKAARSSEKPDLFHLLLASPMARLLHMKRNIVELRSFLDDCFQLIDGIGRGIPASVLGWLFYMRARAQCDTTDAIADFKLAIDAFNKSDNEDKEFGSAHGMCRLIICILKCGEEADTIHEDPPFPSAMRETEQLLQRLENMGVLCQCIVIRILYLMAKSDYSFRTRKFGEVLKFAKEAHDLAKTSKCMEFHQVTRNRIDAYTAELGRLSRHEKQLTISAENATCHVVDDITNPGVSQAVQNYQDGDNNVMVIKPGVSQAMQNSQIGNNNVIVYEIGQ